MPKLICVCCGRQVTKNGRTGNKYEAPFPAKKMFGPGEVCCADCDDLDENGLFPGEPGYKGKFPAQQWRR